MKHGRVPRRCGPIAVPVALLLVFAGSVTSMEAQERPYHILLTNDDGIESPGIQALARELRGVGEVLLVAPCGERSGSSMSVMLRQTRRLRPVERNGQPAGHCVDSSPAGVVMLGITTLAPEGGFDLVVSGINRGANVGDLSHMSGTVGGAMMGAFYGVPAIAASLDAAGRNFTYASEFVAQFVGEMRRRPALPGIGFSINIPKASEAEIAGVEAAPMGGSYLAFQYEEPGADQVEGDEPGRTFRPNITLASEFPEGSDTQVYMSDRITITPLAFDWTAHEVLQDLRGWNLSHEIR